MEYKLSPKAIEVAQSIMDIAGAMAYKLYKNLLSYEAHQLCKKILKAQINTAPWDDLIGAIN